ncbi:hypothetical protein [Streptococcus constellatus]|uniref:Uncharacterized protein n=1 Tax=Streptococcus constellatus subsp. constellatus SK53 TaxID=1095730 RepID=A0AAD2SVF3_STRCV|nr:hypothetical protein [Streptococcus constellatus]EID19864.1 hypothetical protein HMPREF1044_1800 [Streptococcus constellatus subsp. constellatus SK53]QQT04793.1 hypothetical protein I6J13_04765 [Streptococcus constellatus]SUN41064.1 Uncharacterised protein [Streptococcus constellatus]BBD23128.1 DNA-binding helix-turn-helix protein [Streptococcus constellatus subsp. constellatus]GAD39429.1 hypothetical protein ANG2_1756 [Streptococcus constellatus subsp. constellatus SK53]
MKNDKKTVGAVYMIWLLLGITLLLVGLTQKNRTFIVIGFSNIILGFTLYAAKKKSDFSQEDKENDEKP